MGLCPLLLFYLDTMIIFDQLRISDDGKRLYINLHVNNADYFEHVYLDSLTIMTHEKVSGVTDPMSPTEDYIYKKTYEGSQKEEALVLTAEDFFKIWETDPKAMRFRYSEMSKTLFFVYVKVKIAIDEGEDFDIPCGLDREITVGVTFDTAMLYQLVMNYTRELAQDCVVPQGFTDLILLWNAFKSAIETEHYIPAIRFWDMLFGKEGKGIIGNGSINSKGCGCHG